MTHENRIEKDKIVFKESGTGKICLGDSHYNISFSLLQLSSGRNICEIEPEIPSKDYFNKINDELNLPKDSDLKINISEKERVVLFNSTLSGYDFPDLRTRHYPTKVSIDYDDCTFFDEIQFGLVNLIVDQDFILNSSFFKDSLSLNIVSIEFKKKENFDDLIYDLTLTSYISNTFTLIIKTQKTEHSKINEYVYFIENICTLLSIAQGRKIDFVQFRVLHDNKLINQTLLNKNTLPFGQTQLVGRNSRDLRLFLESAYSKYIDLNRIGMLDRGLIDIFCQAKTNSSMLEAKGIELVVFMEILKSKLISLHKKHRMDAISNDIATKFLNYYDKDREKVCKNELKYCHYVKLFINYCNIKSINDGCTDEICTKCKRYTAEKCSLKRFVDQRNSLIHDGRFCDLNKNLYDYGDQKVNEKISCFIFIEQFVHIILLGLLEFKGNYLFIDDRTFKSKTIPFPDLIGINQTEEVKLHEGSHGII